MKSKHLLLPIFFLLLGCASVDITKTAKGYYDPTDPNEVEILKTIPNRPYEELGTITALDFNPTDTAVLHNAVRAKVAPLGANAAILTQEGINPNGWGAMTRWAMGVAIRYKDSSSPSRAEAPPAKQ
jgi:hypothetical protein